VSQAPEEVVRVALVKRMVEQLGYPKGFITVEKELAQLPHLQSVQNIPKRRLDILVFSQKEEGELFPLLLIECKAVDLKSNHATQLIGYNSFVQAPFIALANQEHLFIADANTLDFQENLPNYEELRAKTS